MFTFGELKTQVRQRVFPYGEAPNLVASHNKSFIDALIDLQTWVDCLQQDNTQLVPQCATLYNCGLTMFDAPRGIIRGLSVIDKINPTTLKEDATAADDWCSEIFYREVDFCHVRKYLSRASGGCCFSIPLFFAIPGCKKGLFAPVPTDEGLTALPRLPLGFHYGQSSTDDARGRSPSGIWAKERGKIYIGPWLQTTETAVIKWDGIKRSWTDGDPIDDDPLLVRAIEEFVRYEHASKFDRDNDEAGRALGTFEDARANLIHQCREETRARECEPSHARAASITNTSLFYNDEQHFTARCPDNQTGSQKTFTVPAGSIASAISVDDANRKALNEAQSQAEAQLDCADIPETFTNDEQSFTAQCTSESGIPTPDGNPVTITIDAGTVSSTISKAAANALALAQAQEQAEAALSCTYWNSEQTYTAECPDNTFGTPVSKITPERTISSTISQADADAKALAAAKSAADQEIVCDGGPVFFLNTAQVATAAKICPNSIRTPCSVEVVISVAPNIFSSLISQAQANVTAFNAGRAAALQRADLLCSQNQCGIFTYTYP